VGIPIPKIWLIFGHGIYPSGDLDLLLFTLELVCNVNHGMHNLPANFGACDTFLYKILFAHLQLLSSKLPP